MATIKQFPADREALMHHFYAAFNERNLDALDELMAADVVDHNPIPDQPKGLAGVKMALAGFYAAFSDIQIEQILVADNHITVRQIARGTHDGDFLGNPATGCPVAIISGYWAHLAENLRSGSHQQLEFDSFSHLTQKRGCFCQRNPEFCLCCRQVPPEQGPNFASCFAREYSISGNRLSASGEL
jgi:hypothetical protein